MDSSTVGKVLLRGKKQVAQEEKPRLAKYKPKNLEVRGQRYCGLMLFPFKNTLGEFLKFSTNANLNSRMK